MPSPFPGMDPYLESWICGDFHSSLIVALGAQLNAKLPPRYVARLHIRPEDPLERRFLRVVNIAEKRILTELEVPSPSNLTSHHSTAAGDFNPDEFITSRLNYVEIDLLRSRVRPSLGAAPLPAADYYVLARRATAWQHLLVWPFSVRDRVPMISIPLGPELPEVLLDIRSAMDRAYDEGRYAEQLDYTKPPAPPLREPDASRARELLASRPSPQPTA